MPRYVIKPQHFVATWNAHSFRVMECLGAYSFHLTFHSNANRGFSPTEHANYSSKNPAAGCNFIMLGTCVWLSPPAFKEQGPMVELYVIPHNILLWEVSKAPYLMDHHNDFPSPIMFLIVFGVFSCGKLFAGFICDGCLCNLHSFLQ